MNFKRAARELSGVGQKAPGSATQAVDPTLAKADAGSATPKLAAITAMGKAPKTYQMSTRGQRSVGINQ